MRKLCLRHCIRKITLHYCQIHRLLTQRRFLNETTMDTIPPVDKLAYATNGLLKEQFGHYLWSLREQSLIWGVCSTQQPITAPILQLTLVTSPLISHVFHSILVQNNRAEEQLHDTASVLDASNETQMPSSNDHCLKGTESEVINTRNHGQEGMTFDTTIKDHPCDDQDGTQFPSTKCHCGICLHN